MPSKRAVVIPGRDTILLAAPPGATCFVLGMAELVALRFVLNTVTRDDLVVVAVERVVTIVQHRRLQHVITPLRLALYLTRQVQIQRIIGNTLAKLT